MARVGSSDAALKGYEAALKRWPGDLPAMIGMANIHNDRRDHARAIAILRDAQAKHPQSAIDGSALPTAEFSGAVREAKVGGLDQTPGEIPHVTKELILKYADDISLLGLI